jgi:hypothetical protein
MKTEINPSNSLLFLLQREYVRECKIEPAKDENGNEILDQNGQKVDRAIHPLNQTFPEWLQSNNLIVNKPTIIRPDSIVKPLNFTK